MITTALRNLILVFSNSVAATVRLEEKIVKRVRKIVYGFMSSCVGEFNFEREKQKSKK